MVGAAQFSDFIIFADESGDHGLINIDPDFPMFALSFCVFEKKAYMNQLVPSVQNLKFELWGHDSIVFHEQEIRKRTGPFTLLLSDPNLRERFFERMNSLIEEAEFEIVASVIRKDRLKNRYADPFNPYQIALLFCLERLLKILLEKGQEGRLVHILFESRGKKEDEDLELEFRRICGNENILSRRRNFKAVHFEPLFVKKAANSPGLQFADLTARPIAIHHLRPAQDNRAYDIIKGKLYKAKCFP